MATPPTSRHPGTLLVVDDDPTILEVLRAVLADDGYRVLVAPTIDLALDLLRAFRVQLVLVDAFRDHADPDPWANLDRIRARARETPVVIVSAHSEKSFTGYAQRGFADLLTKPFDLDELSALVRQTIAHGRDVQLDRDVPMSPNGHR